MADFSQMWTNLYDMLFESHIANHCITVLLYHTKNILVGQTVNWARFLNIFIEKRGIPYVPALNVPMVSVFAFDASVDVCKRQNADIRQQQRPYDMGEGGFLAVGVSG